MKFTRPRPGADVPPEHVVVIGASLAGLFAAAAAADQPGGPRRVTVLERGPLPDGTVARPEVPQGRQPHVFLYRGLLAMEELLPGLRADLLAAGALPFDTGELAWLGEFGWAAPGRREFEILSATRPLLESVVRRRVRALPGVEIRPDITVTGLRRAASGWTVHVGETPTVHADLVVDASGRGSRLPHWLAAAGLPVAQTSAVDAQVGYATRMYAGIELTAPGVVVLSTPATMAGGLALRVEGGRWLVCAVGSGELRPPRDPAGFTAFLAGLRDPVLAALVEEGEPVGDVAVHRQTANHRHHYEKVRGWPDRLLAIGDSFCTFNPVYGQGVTVAACEALLLKKALTAGFPAGSTRRLLHRFASVASVPWAIATGEDLRYPTSTGSQTRLQAALSGWARSVARLAADGDERAQRTLTRLYHLMGSPLLVFHPAFASGVLRARLTGYRPPVPRPDGLPVPASAPWSPSYPAQEGRTI